MCCHDQSAGRQGYGGCCGRPGWEDPQGFRRQFATRNEQSARLEDYLKELQAEARAVQEKLDELKRT